MKAGLPVSFENGDWVYIETKRGRVKQKAFLSESLHPRVVCADFGWWFPEEGKYELHGWKDANINLLFDDQSLDRQPGDRVFEFKGAALPGLQRREQ